MSPFLDPGRPVRDVQHDGPLLDHLHPGQPLSLLLHLVLVDHGSIRRVVLVRPADARDRGEGL
jgi:hypothetical protein